MEPTVEGVLRWRPLRADDLPLLGRWLAEPRVARWWNNDSSPEGVERDFGPGVRGEEPGEDLLVSLDGGPVGLVQRCVISDYAEDLAELAALVDVPDGTVELDYLIGDPALRGRGLGSRIIAALVADTWRTRPATPAVIVPVVAANVASWRALEKAGFRRVAEGDLTPDNPVDDPRHVVYRVDRPVTPDRRPDTAQRSLEHWSEAGRAGMNAFYALAVEDYRQLARARDWTADLREHARHGSVRLLDVACGSGKFPAALLATGLPAEPVVQVDLLDPSAFSLAEARRVYGPPFVVAAEHEVVLQDFARHGVYDVAWATHALYALPPDELGSGLARMAVALRPGGFGVVAQASAASHYLAFYEAYRTAFAPAVAPYTDAEGVAAALRSVGVDVGVQVLHYRTRSADRAVVEGFLQRCAFDDTVTLTQMEAEEPLAAYLAGCRTADGGYKFRHEVHVITWEQQG